jgi:hypothetical protein
VTPDLAAQKTEWVTEPLHIPRSWRELASQIGRPSESPRATILRRALRLGLPLVAKQEAVAEKWVSETLAQPTVAPKRGRPANCPGNERKARS